MTQVKNKVNLIGKICVPRIEIAESGIKVAEFLVYVYETFYNNEGEKVGELMKHLCKAHGKLAEDILEQFSKTAEFTIEGVLITSSYKLRGWTIPLKHIQITGFSILSDYPAKLRYQHSYHQ